MTLSVQLPFKASDCWVTSKLEKYRPIFDRVDVAVVFTRKSATKLIPVCPATQELIGVPSGFLVLITFATLTSLAVQFSFWVTPAWQDSFCKQLPLVSVLHIPPANAGIAVNANMAIASSTNTNVLQQFVRQLIFPPQKIGVAGRRWVRLSRPRDAGILGALHFGRRLNPRSSRDWIGKPRAPDYGAEERPTGVATGLYRRRPAMRRETKWRAAGEGFDALVALLGQCGG